MLNNPYQYSTSLISNHQMIKIFLFLLNIVLNIASPTDAEPVQPTTLESLSPEVNLALSLLKKTHSSTTTQIIERASFDKINNIFDRSQGDVKLEKLTNLIDFWLTTEQFNLVQESDKKALSRAITEYRLTAKQNPYLNQKYTISFSNGMGKMFMLLINLEPDKQRNDIIHWEKMILVCDFVPSAPYVIATESDCNLLGCDRTDVIKFLPAVATNYHIDTVTDMNRKIIEGFSNNRKSLA